MFVKFCDFCGTDLVVQLFYSQIRQKYGKVFLWSSYIFNSRHKIQLYLYRMSLEMRLSVSVLYRRIMIRI